MKASKSGLPILLFFSSLLPSLIFSNMAIDIMTPNQTIGVNETIVSAGGIYELGFFSPGIAKNWYLGIWYKKISAGTNVWVANRDVPLVDPLGVLQITNTGILVLVTSNDSIIWSSNSSKPVHNPIAQLLDTGNFIIREADDSDPKKYLWQSFDYISNTLLPGMKLGKNLRSGTEWLLTSWKSLDDPSPGNFTCGINMDGFPQVGVMSGNLKMSQSGLWNGIRFTGIPSQKWNPFYSFGFISNEEEVYYYTEHTDSSFYTRLVLDPNGLANRYTWVDRTKAWVLYLSTNSDNCDAYAWCGAYSNCKIDDTPDECSCLKGFVPKYPKDWERADWLNGCVRRTALDCPRDRFVKHTGLKLPDTKYSWYNTSMNLEECRMMCLKNCSCTAYTNTDIRRGGSGCLLWFGELMDIRQFNENGQDLYVRMAASEIAEAGHMKKQEWVIVAASVTMVALILFGLACALYIRWRKQRKGEHSRDEKNQSKEDTELPIYAFSTIVNSTNNFSDENKLGEGGFGPVYKGILKGGQEIAVKRLSKFSTQGLGEFKNEVDCIAKLQHRNLVKLLGWCSQAEERMLIYEYMLNKSLDCFLFDEKRRFLLDWPKRFTIINGIARGLLYLHQDSRFRIIHRDLKIENILLDNEMNPKISDFGMARSFGGNETQAITNKVVGTFGYIAPEYAVRGLYSIKSDVYSFGVLVLEIISGRRNREFHHPDNSLNLLGHAWEYYMQGRSLELIDSAVERSSVASEVVRSIQVGLLCVQQSSKDRPNMLTVTMMLGGEGIMPRPKQPAFFTGRSRQESNSSSNKFAPCSINDVIITELEAR